MATGEVELGGDRPADRLYFDVDVPGMTRLVIAGDDRGDLVPARFVGQHVAGVAVADHVVVPVGVG